MSQYSKPKYDVHRDYLKKTIEKDGWQKVEEMGINPDSLQSELEMMKRYGPCPNDMTIELWNGIFDELKKEEQKSQKLSVKLKESTLVAAAADNNMTAPTEPTSSWKKYKAKLIKDGYSNESIDEIEHTTVKILRKLNNNTRELGPVKGAVIGNVQSGKTGNMAALMAMAADWGWNTFIVLSGIIENLRKQTEKRLIKDLNQDGNLAWVNLLEDDPDNLLLNDHSKKRYLTVCLKNIKRLINLNTWLKTDEQKLEQMRILIIDDEADQAGINTRNITEAERSAINNAIVELVEIKGKQGEEPLAMNYISYTATPYANLLNESTPESLYPKDFIAVLNPADEYFGPKQIFGLEESEEYRGLKIIRTIVAKPNIGKSLVDECKEILGIHQGKNTEIPTSLKKAVYWFLCAASVMRYRKYKKPISMLIHTSQKQGHHQLMASALKSFFKQQTQVQILQECEKVYADERHAMTLEDFKLDFESYPLKVKDYPPFDKIQAEIARLIDQVSEINFGIPTEGGELKYHKGLHVCIDNCANNGTDELDHHVRLAYPTVDTDSPRYPSPAPVFIIIGGNTLSRGLTIEGLVSTYFLRTTKQADTLMQMGRFFGYRKGYELLPRIWITEDTEKKFKFLSMLEEELREDLKTFIFQGGEPQQYGPKVKNSPQASWLQITAKNRMKSAIETDVDFAGSTSQTVLFDNEEGSLQNNITVTESFINKLGNAKITQKGNGIYWTNVQFGTIQNEFLLKFKFNSNSRVFNQIGNFCEWFEQTLTNSQFDHWNVVVSGTGKVDDSNENIWKVGQHSVGKVNRTRKGKSAQEQEIINIGALRTPGDLYADISQELYLTLPDDSRDFTISKISYIREVRRRAGLGDTPQLLIYRIKKDSKPQDGTTTERFALEATEDLIGVSIFIPGKQGGSSLATKLTIQLPYTEGTSYDEIEGDAEE